MPGSIKIVGDGEFQIKSSRSLSFEAYTLSFGDEENMPCCSCNDWAKSAYPCKHFFAVFKTYPAWSWDALPEAYRSSVFLALDETFDFPIIISNDMTEEDPVNDKDNDFDFKQKGKQETKADSKTSQTTGNKVRQILNNIRGLSYLVENRAEILDDVHANLLKLEQSIYMKIPKEKGLLLRPVVNNVKKNNVNKYKDLQTRKRKNPFSRRVGELNNKKIKASKIAISPLKNLAKTSIIEEEVVCTNQENKIGNDEFKDSLQQEITVLSDDEDTEINQSIFTSRQQLCKADLKSLSEKGMLNDTIIHVFQSMIQKQYPDIEGLQDPILGSRLSFSVYKNKPFLQILHDGSLHWVAVSTYECAPGEVFYMDSLLRRTISHKVKQQICSIMHCSSPCLKIKVLPVHQQTNGVDCGLYAIAFTLYYAINRKYPTEVTFDQQLMRHHLLRALAANTLGDFPLTNKKWRKCVKLVI